MVIGFVVDGVAGLMVVGGTVARGLFGWCAFVPPKTFSWYQTCKLRPFVPSKTFSWNKTEFHTRDESGNMVAKF